MDAATQCSSYIDCFFLGDPYLLLTTLTLIVVAVWETSLKV